MVPADQEPPRSDADPSIHERVSCAGGEVVVHDAIDRFTIALHRGGETMEIPTALRFPVVLDVDPSGTRVLVGVDRGARSEPLHEFSVSSGALAPVIALSHPMGAYAGEAIGTVSLHGVWLVSRTGAIVAREEFSVDQAFGGHAIQHATGPSPQGRHVLIRMGDGRATLAVFREDGVSLVRDVAEGVADVFTHHGVIHAVIDDVICRLELGPPRPRRAWRAPGRESTDRCPRGARRARGCGARRPDPRSGPAANRSRPESGLVRLILVSSRDGKRTGDRQQSGIREDREGCEARRHDGNRPLRVEPQGLHAARQGR
ncbi:MAG: hypothetical protein IPJ34_26935 [Myxococcales bacterium]|nr:hypothetical protein [Myxococcales bacterium]